MKYVKILLTLLLPVFPPKINKSFDRSGDPTQKACFRCWVIQRVIIINTNRPNRLKSSRASVGMRLEPTFCPFTPSLKANICWASVSTTANYQFESYLMTQIK